MSTRNKPIEFNVGDFIKVPVVRSNHLDRENGIGWYGNDVTVQVSKVMDLSLCYELNGETHYELKSEVEKTNDRPNLFGEMDKIKYAKDDFRFRHNLY